MARAGSRLVVHWLTAKKPIRIVAAILLSAAGLYWDVFLRHGDPSLNIYTIARCLPEFTLGICCYELCNRWRPGTRLAVFLSSSSVLAFIASLAFVPIKAWRDLACVLSFCIFIPSVIHLRGPFVQGFNRLFGYLGEISYSIYLVHPVVLLAFTNQFAPMVKRSTLPNPAATALIYSLTTLLVISAAALSYRFIELPTRTFFKRFGRRPMRHSIPAQPIPAAIVITSPGKDSASNG